MEKLVSFIILLIAAVLLAPGCMAEVSTAADTSGVLNAPGNTQNIGLFNDANTTGTVGEVSVLEPAMGDITNATETGGEIAVNETATVDGADVTEVAGLPMANATMVADVNTTDLTATLDDTILISLRENPTTGYLWNVTNSSGLEILSDEYVMDKAPEGMVGVGGVHDWMVKAVETGNQTFSAVLMHVADKPTGEEEMYTLNVTVEETTKEPVNETPLKNPVGNFSVI